MDKFFTVKDVSQIFRVSTRTISTMIREGRLKAVAIGGSKRVTYRIYEKEIDRFMAENYETIGKKNDDISN